MPYKLSCPQPNHCKVAEKEGGKHPGRTFSKAYLTRDKAIRQLAAIKMNEGSEKGEK